MKTKFLVTTELEIEHEKAIPSAELYNIARDSTSFISVSGAIAGISTYHSNLVRQEITIQENNNGTN